MKEQIKELRVRIDGLSQLTKELKPIKSFIKVVNINSDGNIIAHQDANVENSKETEKATDNLYLAKAWLGKMLGELGESTPYANDGKRKTVEDIEPTADKPVNFGNNIGESNWYNGNFNATESKGDLIIKGKHWSDFNHIQKVDWLRQEIQHLTHLVYQYCVENLKTRFHSKIAYRHLCEARFWLGFELERIKNNK